MGRADLTAAQRQRVADGHCAAPRCGRPHATNSDYCAAGRAGQTCRARASRERRRYRASPEGLRNAAEAEARGLREQLRRVEAQLDQIQARRRTLQRRLQEAEDRADGQVVIPAVDPAPAHPPHRIVRRGGPSCLTNPDLVLAAMTLPGRGLVDDVSRARVIDLASNDTLYVVPIGLVLDLIRDGQLRWDRTRSVAVVTPQRSSTAV